MKFENKGKIPPAFVILRDSTKLKSYESVRGSKYRLCTKT